MELMMVLVVWALVALAWGYFAVKKLAYSKEEKFLVIFPVVITEIILALIFLNFLLK